LHDDTHNLKAEIYKLPQDFHSRVSLFTSKPKLL